MNSESRSWAPGDPEPGNEVTAVRMTGGRHLRYRRNPLGGWSRDLGRAYSHVGHTWDELLDFRGAVVDDTVEQERR